jgi:hypothetical protein
MALLERSTLTVTDRASGDVTARAVVGMAAPAARDVLASAIRIPAPGSDGRPPTRTTAESSAADTGEAEYNAHARPDDLLRLHPAISGCADGVGVTPEGLVPSTPSRITTRSWDFVAATAPDSITCDGDAVILLHADFDEVTAIVFDRVGGLLAHLVIERAADHDDFDLLGGADRARISDDRLSFDAYAVAHSGDSKRYRRHRFSVPLAPSSPSG